MLLVSKYFFIEVVERLEWRTQSMRQQRRLRMPQPQLQLLRVMRLAMLPALEPLQWLRSIA